ncbi:hypothetical protein S83_011974, partial [Arachis hypogaea]
EPSRSAAVQSPSSWVHRRASLRVTIELRREREEKRDSGSSVESGNRHCCRPSRCQGKPLQPLPRVESSIELCAVGRAIPCRSCFSPLSVQFHRNPAPLSYMPFLQMKQLILWRRFVRAAQGVSETPSLQLECLTNYIAELSLLEYNMLCYAPSLIAASAIFLAKFILSPSTKPWNATLKHYTQYQPSDLCSCVRDLHRLCCNHPNSNLPAIREKYSQHKIC